MSNEAILEDIEAAESNKEDKADIPRLVKELNESMYNEDTDLWIRLSKLSIKKRDLDSLLYTLTKMRMARVARDVRQQPTTATALATGAVNLSMRDEAEAILRESGDTHALSSFYQITGKWKKAIDVSDRLNVKNVYYKYAKFLETQGEVVKAIDYFERSGTHTFEVPRMLFNLGDIQLLHDYCLGVYRPLNEGKGSKGLSTKDTTDQEAVSPSDRIKLVTWWGQYCESQGRMEEALESYQEAKDCYDQVRLLCFLEKVDKAKEIISNVTKDDQQEMDDQLVTSMIQKSRDSAALFLARQLEQSSPSESVEYYLSCRAVKHAIRVCKNHGSRMANDLVDILVNYGTREEARELLASGEFENITDTDRDGNGLRPGSLVRLFQKAGDTKKAVEVSIEHRSWDQLRDIIKEMVEEAERESQGETDITQEIIDLAMSALRNDSEISDVVIDLLLLSSCNDRMSMIESLLTDFNVEVTDQLVDKVDKISKTRGSGQGMMSLLADLSLRQGKYLTAAKIYNSLGDRVNSLKALIREGDREKIINYANIARDKGVYRLAGNFLQTVDHPDRELIASFYKKAGAREELQRFLGGGV